MVEWRGIQYEQVKDIPSYRRKQYKAAHPRPSTQEKYMQFAQEYVTNGFNAVKAWRTIYPNQTDTTSHDLPYVVLKWNKDVHDFVEEAKRDVADLYGLDWCVAQLGKIAEGDETAAKDKIAAIKGVQSQLIKLKEMAAKEKATEKTDTTIKVELVGDDADEDTDQQEDI